MKICVLNNYIVGYSESCGTEVPNEKWEDIQSAWGNKPQTESGYQMMLRFDTLQWESVKLIETQDEEPSEIDISDSEALQIILGGESI